MLLQRKSLAIVAPSGEKYLIFMLRKVRKRTIFLPAKNYQNSLKRALLRQKKLHWPRLIWPTRYTPCSKYVLLFDNNCGKCRPIFKILSPGDS